jgi:DNA-binding MarR family transcriptional regulator
MEKVKILMKTTDVKGVLEQFYTLYPAMPLTYILTFIWVAENEGKHQFDLEQYLGLSNATASRCIKWWGTWKDKKKQTKGLEFIESYPDPIDERYRVVQLTKIGKAFYERTFKP